ncbi:MAG: single-stranded-DNA-specific exonuclease RecJ [Anaerolineales bacterium]
MTHSRRWLIPPPLTREAEAALNAFPPILRQVLFNRGYATYDEARFFLEARPSFNPDPFQMTGMRQAVERIRRALAQGETIVIYGDYDVDGVTATALLTDTLTALGGKVRGYIPNRFDEGYGLNKEALSQLKQEGVGLVISVDCGIRSPDEAHHARTIGLDLVITDHHHPLEGLLPPALAVLNPKQPGDAYPDKDLAGVGIAYKLAEALLTPRESHIAPDDLLDLTALGTVADLAPLVGENRFLVRRGLRQMREKKRQGLLSLAAVSGVDITRVNATDIGFRLGPRLNASGRLESALASYELLTTRDIFRAGQLAQQLDVQNRERQRLTRKIQQQAETLALAEDPQAWLLFAAHEDFNPGVVGLAASRLVETHYRPAIVAQRGPHTTRGSCRSIPEFHITNALDQCVDLLVRHGGHAAAAGFTVENDKLEELVTRLKRIAREQLSGQDLRPTLRADAEVALKNVRPDLFEHLKYLEPTGYGNPPAVFVARSVKVKSARCVGSDGKHLKLTLEDEHGMTHDAIGFGLGHLQASLTARLDIMFTYETNEYNGRVNFQLNLKDVKPAGTPD